MYIVLFSFSISCNQGVVFEDSNPPNIDKVDQLPQYLLGSYLCQSDSSIVHIYKDYIVQEILVEFKTSLDKIAETENCSLVDGGLYLPGRKECIPFEYINEDTITATLYELDTLFYISRDNIAKVYKGQLFLNIKSHSYKWMTWIVRPDSNGNLIYRYIDIPQDRNVIENYTKDYTVQTIEPDKIQYSLKPTLREFEEIANSEYAVLCDVLQPISLEFRAPDRIN